MRWESEALCLNRGPDPWFSPDRRIRDAAARLCEICPVQQPCLNYAIDNDITYGIWGGKTPLERRRMIRSSR